MALFFSLVLPVYNVAPYLERCLRSILSQEMTDYEVILVDDGSTDASPAICDAYAAENGCVRVIHKENGGLSSARNAGMMQAGGRYVWFIDSDDWVEPDALTRLREACTDDPDMVKFGYSRVQEQHIQAVPGIIAPGVYRGDDIDPLRREAFCRAGRYQLSAWSHVYRRDFLEQHQLAFVSERVICSEDYLFSLQALLKAEFIRVLDASLYCYDLRQGSLTQAYKADLALRYTALYERLRDWYRQEGALEKYGALIDRFYVWHLMIGTCMAHEYRRIGTSRTEQEARGKIREMLKSGTLRQAAAAGDRAGIPWRKKVHLLAIRLRAEGYFHYLFTRKGNH